MVVQLVPYQSLGTLNSPWGANWVPSLFRYSVTMQRGCASLNQDMHDASMLQILVLEENVLHLICAAFIKTASQKCLRGVFGVLGRDHHVGFNFNPKLAHLILLTVSSTRSVAVEWAALGLE